MPSRRSATSILTRAYQRNLKTFTRAALGSSNRLARKVTAQVGRAVVAQRKPPPGAGDWLTGMAGGPAGARGYHLYRPAGLNVLAGEKLPLMVMLHGCGQTGREFALSTRMNRLADRERFYVLYPEQDRLHHPQGCWHWYDTRSGKAEREAATLMLAIDQVCALYAVDTRRVAVAGMSAGAGMAALLATGWPHRFKAVAMHSGVAPGAAKSSATAFGAMRGVRAPAMPATAVGKAMGAAALGTTLPPLLIVHGDADRIVSARNATNAAAVWATATGALPKPARALQRGKRHPMRVVDFLSAGRMRVKLCEVAGLGHSWSGGAASAAFSDPLGPDASKMVWAFAARAFGSDSKKGGQPNAKGAEVSQKARKNT